MSTSRSLVFAVLTVLTACKGAESGEGAKGDKAPADEAAAAPAEPAPEAEAGETGANDGGETAAGTDTGDEEPPAEPLPDAFEAVGVEVCDQYVADYVACIDAGVPEAEREAQRRAVFDNVKVWKQTAAGGPSAEKGLQTACRIAREQAKRATADWGCEW